jgi:hypothetical protein
VADRENGFFWVFGGSHLGGHSSIDEAGVDGTDFNVGVRLSEVHAPAGDSSLGESISLPRVSKVLRLLILNFFFIHEELTEFS